MLKILWAVALVASALSVSPAFAAVSQAPTMQPPDLSFAVAKHKLPWCSATVTKHCRHHHKAAAPAM